MHGTNVKTDASYLGSAKCEFGLDHWLCGL